VGRNIHLIFVENLKAIKMDKNNLVILRGSNELKLGSDTLTPNEHYRRLSNGEDSHIVNGIRMNELFFNEYFEYSYTRVIRDWTDMNLIVNGNPIKKRNSKNIWIFIVMEITK
jgi:hypothetical protein